jgi:hypothetical protein
LAGVASSAAHQRYALKRAVNAPHHASRCFRECEVRRKAEIERIPGCFVVTGLDLG